jgi:methylated-DNA-[protein]-cysteine S-methyltransferase
MTDIERALKGGALSDPGERARRAARRLADAAEAAGLIDVSYAVVDSPLGPLTAAATEGGLIRLSYFDEEEVLEDLSRRVSPRILERPESLDYVREQLEEYFEGRRSRFELPLDWRLTRGFSRDVLQATARIPFGSVASYRQVAARSGSPRAARAAGNALARNPIPIVVPCHRVVASAGTLGGYTGGLDRKRFLLDLEGVSL